MFWIIFGFIIIVLFFWWLLTCFVVVPQAHEYLIERLGAYYTTWGAGLHFRAPIIDKVVRKISLKEQVSDFEPQAVITRDNVTMTIDSVVYWKVFDSHKFTYNIERPIAAIENLTSTTLRNIVGAMTLDETLVGRDSVNAQMLQSLDEATNNWGIDITRVEVQNINPPAQIKEAMEKQMKAERDKRARILEAEGQKQAAITAAEGEKEAAILRADAAKEQLIRKAQGEAEALLAVQKANAAAMKLVNDVNPSDKVLTLKSLDALKEVANGQATKIIVPSNIQDLTGLIAGVKESIKG